MKGKKKSNKNNKTKSVASQARETASASTVYNVPSPSPSPKNSTDIHDTGHNNATPKTQRAVAAPDPKRLEELQKQIDAIRKITSALPLSQAHNERARQGEIFKDLADKVEEYELLLEANRIESVVRNHQKHHTLATEECPVCLEETQITDIDSMSHFLCCGGELCIKCFKLQRLKNCPLCRENFPTEIQAKELKMKLAKRGVPWAQHEIALGYFNGRENTRIDKKLALEWFEKAAKNRYPLALKGLGLFYYTGEEGVVSKSFTKAFPLLKDAADLGSPQCQEMVGVMYCSGQGVPEDHSKGLEYFTLAYSQGQKMISEFMLGKLLHDGSAGLKSFVRAKHYLEEQAGNDNNADVSYYLGMTLMKLAIEQCQGRNIPGHSTVPRTFYLMRKAAEEGNNDAPKMVSDMEEHYRAYCATCGENAKDLPETMKRCNRCKGVWYCGKECQKYHWKLGHKVDCVES